MRKAALFFVAFALAAALAWGLEHLFQARFAQGDIYPPYSTLRADGIGTKALYDSLAEMMNADRNYEPLDEFHPATAPSTIFILGAGVGTDVDDDEDDTALLNLAREGHRIVIGFNSYVPDPDLDAAQNSDTPPPKKHTAKKKPKDDKPKEEKPKDAKPGDKKTDEAKVQEHRDPWGVKVGYQGTPPQKANTSEPGLEPELPWHTTAYFKEVDPAWRTLYRAGGKPVIIERAYGKGSIVLAAETYFASNEALSKDRAPGLLSALVGNSRAAVFDETHLGLDAPDEGVAMLARKYRLHGVALALLCVAGLFIWRNLFSFVPPGAEAARQDSVVQGVDAASGFVGMLRRNIPGGKLVATCVAEWKRSFGHQVKPATMTEIELLASSGAGQALHSFRTITQILNQKK